ncbi:MAG: tRNA preQ1(34) S-adenosylmethionine ribosyltransferase-isomerase QueA [Patescibacteria group bacterium]
MYLKHFNYLLPNKHIAQKPVNPRDHSRLLVLDKNSGELQHKHFYDISEFLNKGDVVVMNNSKVIPARLLGQKETGGKMEIFLLNKVGKGLWEVLVGGKGQKENLTVLFPKNLKATLIERKEGGTWIVSFNKKGEEFEKLYKKIGEAPVPPYIKEKSDLKKYQTVYAKKEGSVAAPTAGFHFTKGLINSLKRKGVEFQEVTLHVGLGTFQPVKVSDITKHKMHPEFVDVPKETLAKLWQAKKDGRRIIAVGTTSVRVLETVMAELKNKKNPPKESFKAWVNIFIYPGFKFKFVDAMITNFHLPESTLLMLVSAFAGRKNILRAYEIAKEKNYRFYSFGDAMLIK